VPATQDMFCLSHIPSVLILACLARPCLCLQTSSDSTPFHSPARTHSASFLTFCMHAPLFGSKTSKIINMRNTRTDALQSLYSTTNFAFAFASVQLIIPTKSTRLTRSFAYRTSFVQSGFYCNCKKFYSLRLVPCPSKS